MSLIVIQELHSGVKCDEEENSKESTDYPSIIDENSSSSSTPTEATDESKKNVDDESGST